MTTTIRAKMINKIPMLALLVFSLSLLIIAFFFIQVGRENDEWATPLASALILWIATYIVASYFFYRSIYLFSNGYLTVLLIFHLGLFFQYAFGLVNIPSWDGVFGEWIYQAIWHVALALAAFGCGLSTYCLLQRRIVIPKKISASPITTYNIENLRSIGVGLLTASVGLLLIAIIQLGNIFKFSRFELLYGNHDTRFIGVFFLIFPTALIALLATTKNNLSRLIVYIFSAISFVLIMLSGNRSYALYPLLTVGIIHVKLGRKIPAPILIGGITIVLLAIPAIGFLRTLNSYEDISMETLVKSTDHAEIKNTFSDLGSSIGILAHTLKIIPAQESYRFGYSYIINLKRTLPNIGATLNTDYSRQALKADITSRGKDALFDMQPSDWASYHIIPEDFLSGAGTGFSTIAEAYFNFGSAGVVVFFLGLGIIFAKIDNISLQHNYRTLLFAALFYWLLLTTVRNDIGVFIKPASFTVIIVFIWMGIRRFFPGVKGIRRVVSS